MSLRARLPRLSAPLLPLLFSAVALLVACGGETVGLGNPGGSLVDAGTPVADSSTGTCVNVELGAFDQSCSSDGDCMLVRTGTICDGQCDCGGDSPINVSGASLYSEETSAISFQVCHCPEVGNAVCVAGQCSLCPAGVDCLSGSSDAGTGEDTGVIVFDSGIGPEDASVDAESTCVEVNLSSYDTSCNQDSDCFTIQTGQVCNGDCSCGGEPINVSGEAQYEQAVSGIEFGECGCPSGPLPSCVGGQCTLVGLGG